MKKIPYLDIADAKEDERIELIGKAVMQAKKIVAFFTDDEPDKPQRYVRKLKAKFPGIIHVWTWPGPVVNVVTVKMSPPNAETN